MLNKEIEIREKLISSAEKDYKKFTEKLIPNCKEIILGVRIPTIRKIAKEIAKNNPIEYLENTTELYFEEIMLKGLIIGNLKNDIDEILKQVSNFIPKITNWSICDSFCSELKITKSNKEKVWLFIKKYWNSLNPYEIRFAIVMMLDYYIDSKYLQDMFNIFDSIKHDDYYVKMAVAWAISKCFTLYEYETFKYLNNNRLDDETYNKALQKIRESLKVSKETKNKINSMRRYNIS